MESLGIFEIAPWVFIILSHIVTTICCLKIKYIKGGKANCLEFNFYLWCFPFNYLGAFFDLLPSVAKNIQYAYHKSPNYVVLLFFFYDIFSIAWLGAAAGLLGLLSENIAEWRSILFALIFVFALPRTLWDFQNMMKFERCQDSIDDYTRECESSSSGLNLCANDVYQDFGAPESFTILSFTGQLILYAYYCAAVYFTVTSYDPDIDKLPFLNFTAGAIIVGAYSLKDTLQDLENQPSQSWRRAHIAAKHGLELKYRNRSRLVTVEEEKSSLQRNVQLSLKEWWIRRLLSLVLNDYGNRLIVLMVAIQLSQIPLQELSEFTYNFAAAFAIREFGHLKARKEYVIVMPHQPTDIREPSDSNYDPSFDQLEAQSLKSSLTYSV